jgi:hypothetical protein
MLQKRLNSVIFEDTGEEVKDGKGKVKMGDLSQTGAQKTAYKKKPPRHLFEEADELQGDQTLNPHSHSHTGSHSSTSKLSKFQTSSRLGRFTTTMKKYETVANYELTEIDYFNNCATILNSETAALRK